MEDSLEDALAERFAPIVFHSDRETTFPTNVDHWLALTDLLFVGGNEPPQLVAAGPLRQAQLLGHAATVQGATVISNGSRSRGKRISFFLGDVGAKRNDSGLQPDEWITYVHSYPNAFGGVALQYWRAYTMNDASVVGIDLGHGGDWEAIDVHLDRREQPVRLTYLDHAGIVDVTRQVKWENSHPLVWSEEGSHSSYTDSSHSRSTRWFRQETWTGGSVTRWDSIRVGVSGGLRNIGERAHPRNGQLFVQYSGLWGARHRLFITSGYWGPAFNETSASCETGALAYGWYLWRSAERHECGRIRLNAWCDNFDSARLDLSAACYAASDVP